MEYDPDPADPTDHTPQTCAKDLDFTDPIGGIWSRSRRSYGSQSANMIFIPQILQMTIRKHVRNIYQVDHSDHNRQTWYRSRRYIDQGFICPKKARSPKWDLICGTCVIVPTTENRSRSRSSINRCYMVTEVAQQVVLPSIVYKSILCSVEMLCNGRITITDPTGQTWLK